MAVTRESEEDGFSLTGSLAFQRFFDCDPNRVIGFRRRNDSFDPRERDAGLEGRALWDRDRLDQALMMELRNQWRVAVVSQAAGMDRGRYEIAPERVHQHQ